MLLEQNFTFKKPIDIKICPLSPTILRKAPSPADTTTGQQQKHIPAQPTKGEVVIQSLCWRALLSDRRVYIYKAANLLVFTQVALLTARTPSFSGGSLSLILDDGLARKKKNWVKER